MPTAGLYCRISRDPTEELAGIDRQREDCLAIAEEHEWTVHDWYIDNDRSAWNENGDRSEFARLIQDFESGLIDCVVVYDIDRMYRLRREAQLLVNTVEDGGYRSFAIASDSGSYNLARPDDRDDFLNSVTSAERYSRQISRKLARKNKARAKAGQPRKSKVRPFGYDWVPVEHRDDGTVKRWSLAINEGDAALIREAANRILQGEPLISIARDWTRRKVPTTYAGTKYRRKRDGTVYEASGEWTPRAVRVVLIAPRCAGFVQRDPKDERVRRRKEAQRLNGTIEISVKARLMLDENGERVRGEWDAILDEETWERLVDRLEDPSRRLAFNQGKLKYVLTGGKAVCGVCGGKLQAGHKSSYVCRNVEGTSKKRVGCRVSQPAGPLEELMREAIVHRLNSDIFTHMQHLAGEHEAQEKRQLDRLTQVQGERDDLVSLLVDRVITQDDFAKQRQRKDLEIDRIKRALPSNGKARLLANLPSGADALRQAWDSRGVKWQRAVVDVLIENVIVHPRSTQRGGIFHPERIEITWRT